MFLETNYYAVKIKPHRNIECIAFYNDKILFFIKKFKFFLNSLFSMFLCGLNILLKNKLYVVLSNILIFDKKYTSN